MVGSENNYKVILFNFSLSRDSDVIDSGREFQSLIDNGRMNLRKWKFSVQNID